MLPKAACVCVCVCVCARVPSTHVHTRTPAHPSASQKIRVFFGTWRPIKLKDLNVKKRVMFEMANFLTAI